MEESSATVWWRPYLPLVGLLLIAFSAGEVLLSVINSTLVVFSVTSVSQSSSITLANSIPQLGAFPSVVLILGTSLVSIFGRSPDAHMSYPRLRLVHQLAVGTAVFVATIELWHGLVSFSASGYPSNGVGAASRAAGAVVILWDSVLAIVTTVLIGISFLTLRGEAVSTASRGFGSYRDVANEDDGNDLDDEASDEGDQYEDDEGETGSESAGGGRSRQGPQLWPLIIAGILGALVAAALLIAIDIGIHSARGASEMPPSFPR